MKNLLIICVMIIAVAGCKSKISNTDTGVTYKDMNVAEANALIDQNKDLVILDVRTPGETALGTIPNAIIIDYNGDNFDDEIAKLNKTKPYLVYCKKGGRSSGAANKMIATGFTDVTNLVGGYSEWSKK